MYFVKTPKIIRYFYKGYYWNIDTDKKNLYLTFDDGPTPKITNFVLETLEQYKAKATFFCIGKNIEQNPEIFKRIIQQGHSVGNHTQNHLNGWKEKNHKYINNVEKCLDTIKHYGSQKNDQVINNNFLFRPPYGKIKRKQAIKLITKSYKIVMWTVLSGDFDLSISKERCFKNVLNNTKKGDVIVFHDSEKAFLNLKYTLPLVLAHFSEKGFTFKNI